MAHIQHFKKSDVKRVVKEFEREDGYNNSDKRIDTLRTPQNYNLDSKKLSSAGAINFLENRLTEVTHSNRKDLNVMSSWVITLPEELKDAPDDKKRLFMSTCFDFVNARYGANNVFGGYVHMDETTPHIHIPFVPVADQQRVSAKALCTRNELHMFHKDLDETMEHTFGQKGLILNGRTKGNYTVKELKARTLEEKYLKEQKERNNAYADSLEDWSRALKAKEDDFVRQQNAFKRDLSDFEVEKAKFSVDKAETQNNIQQMALEAKKLLYDAGKQSEEMLKSVSNIANRLPVDVKRSISPDFNKLKTTDRVMTKELLQKADDFSNKMPNNGLDLSK